MNVDESSVKEEWRPIPGYEGYYEVPNMGNVRSVDRMVFGRNWRRPEGFYYLIKGRLLKPQKKRNGYLQVNLYKEQIHKSILVHRLVAMAFLGPSALTVNHKNEDETDNRLCNLEYMTTSDNVRYSTARPVESYDLKTLETIKQYPAEIDVRQDGYDVGAVNNCCLSKLDGGLQMSRQRSKGTAFETAIVRYLRKRLDDDRIERRALHGNYDLGDIYGLRAHGYEGIIEAKNYREYGPAELAKWREQTVTERGNADADFALLVVHEPGCGKARFGQNSCHMQIRDLEKLVGGTFRCLAGDRALDLWVRVSLDDVCRMVLGE